ncbi:MAG: hypothetical protein ACM3O3_00455 [Syntrophothermus sp.]
MKIILLFHFILSTALLAQDDKFNYDFNATLTSRFIGRGVDCSKQNFGPHIQPTLNLNYKPDDSNILSLSTWSTWGLINEYSELNISAIYANSFKFGEISLAITDYYFPYLKMPFLKIQNNNGEGSHTFDAAISYLGPESFPINFTASNNFYNSIEGENTFYSEIGFPLEINDKISVDTFIGGALGKSSWYEVESNKFEIIHTGFSFNYKIKLMDNFSLPVSLWFIANPHQNKNYTGISFSFAYN